ncbi:C39 family peptidase [Bacillus sp. ISL-47]|uniref:C39 family peptidase n=1 Tax=Bacillus sp. ISL-47 TaxID=2819130 RepID=UPI001BE7666B|nr:C39 family peptidase [Bacillus sp. ISL-47]MBT2687481.1 C39 family peptidase [Bacillus sp. ISL-47]MBT2711170.1 C39 family peptidase [Pseudomonas sp. ISL-84]
MRIAILLAMVLLTGCSAPSGNTGQETEKESVEQENGKVLIDAPHYLQKPELERGCEVTSLAMLLNNAGVETDKMTLSEEINRVPFEEDGYKGNIHEGFVGNMRTLDEPGLGAYHEPVAELAENYLPGKIKDLTGSDFDKIIEQLDDGRPVWVIITSTYDVLPESEWETWETKDGPIKVTYRMHAVLVTGYDDEHIYANDPLKEKNTQYPKNEFIAGWEQIGKQAITYVD